MFFIKNKIDFPMNPISRKFGLDRGTPIDRYYIEDFLSKNRKFIKGDVLEISESTYTHKFGLDNPNPLILSYTKGEDINFVGNLETGVGIPQEVSDCFICTQTFNVIFDVFSGARNALKLLKPGGTLLLTVPGISQISRYDMDRWGYCWSFTDYSVKKLFSNLLPEENIRVSTYGNVKTAAAFLYGYSYEELTKRELDMVDKDYQVTVCAVIKKN